MRGMTVFAVIVLFIGILNVVVEGDTQVWENQYGRLEVYPMNATGLGSFTQWANLTWYYPDNTIDIAFRFNDSLKSGKIWYKPLDTWNQVNMQHTTYNNKHYYYYQGFNVEQDKTYNFKWSYVPKQLTGKWDLIAKLNSDSWATAFSSGRYIFLDPWWNSSWAGKVQLWVNSSYIDTDLLNFPVLVNSTNTAILNACQSNGEDIRFVDDSETKEYCYEIEDFTAGGMNVWVNISDTVSSSSNTSFYMYYGNAAASDNQSVDTWDSNYWIVLHMNDASGFLNDSTNNGTNFKEAGGPLEYQQTGKIGYCMGLDGTDDYFRNTTLDMTGWSQSTFEVWGKPDINAGGNSEYIFSFETDTVGDDDIRLSYYRGATGNGDSGMSLFFDDGGAEGGSDYNHDYYDDHFRYYVGVCDGNSYVYGYENTTRQISDETVNFNFGGLSRDNHNIGRRFTGSKFWDGFLDEIRVSSIARNWSWINATFHSINASDFIEWGTPIADIGPPENLIAETHNITQINLSWTKNTSATHTVIERNTASSWSRGGGTEIYNNTGTTFSASGLTSYTKWYFQAWSYNSTQNKYSASYDSANNITGPSNPTNVATLYSGNGYMNITWVKSPYADTTLVRQKAGSYPTSVTDGSFCYNGTGTFYVHNPVNQTDYFKVWSYNSTVNLYSSGVNAPFGSLIINVYDENTSNAIASYQVFISNANKTSTYENLSASNPCQIDISNLPYGYDTMIKINATDYDFKLYYMDLFVGNQYTLNAYLTPANITESYYIRVINEDSEPIKDATVYVMRYINDTVGYENVSILLSDGSGYTPAVDLVPNRDYAVRIDAGTGYQIEIFDMHPVPIEYGDERWFTFMVSYDETVFPPGLVESEEIEFTGERTGSTVYINFTDNTEHMLNNYVVVYGTNTSNGTVYFFDSFSNTSVNNWTVTYTVNPYDSFIVVLYYNNTYWSSQTRTITISGIRTAHTSTQITTFLTALIGYSPFGWGNLLLWFLLIAGCYYSDGEHAGLIILLLGGMFLTLNVIFGYESTLFTVAGGVIPSLFCLIGVLTLWQERNKPLNRGGR